MTASDIIRTLVKEIVLTPENDEPQIDVRGDLAGILSHIPQKQNLRHKYGGIAGIFGCGARFQKFLPLHQQDWHDPKSLAA